MGNDKLVVHRSTEHQGEIHTEEGGSIDQRLRDGQKGYFLFDSFRIDCLLPNLYFPAA